MQNPQYAMFFDMHTMKACPDVGHGFHADLFARKLQEAGVELLGFHAKCNQGFCYFNTRTGIRHPSLPEGYDLFGDVVAECRKRNIQVTGYFNCGLSNEDAIRHPEWSRISPEGKILHPDIYDLGWVTPYMRTMCPNSPYRDYLLTLIREVRDQYPLRGFLFDSFNTFPCICPNCIRGMKKEGLNPEKPEDVLEFSRRSLLRLAQDIADLLQPAENNLLVNFLGIGSEKNAEIGTYLECECIPTNPCWGYDLLPLTARYFRNLTKGPVFNMTGRFNTWGDFGSLRPRPAVEYDLFFGLANGMRPNIGDHMHPRGDLNQGVFDRIHQIYSKIKTYDPWYENSRNLLDAAVVFSGTLEKSPAIVGFTRMLSELGLQFDFISSSCDWTPYPLLILPDDIPITPAIQKKIEAHLADGKKIIATGTSGLNPEKNAFVFQKEWGAEYLGECECDPAYFRLLGNYAAEMPDLPLSTYARGLKVRALQPANAAGHVVAPYYNHHWDGVYSFFYAPPDKELEDPFLILEKQVAYCAFPLGQSYYRHASPELRKVLEIMLDRLLPAPLLKTGSQLPSFARSFVTRQGNRRIVHLLNYVPELRGETLMVEDEISSNNVKIKLRTDGLAVSRVYLAPDRTELPFRTEGDYISFTIPEVKGYCMAVAESADSTPCR